MNNNKIYLAYNTNYNTLTATTSVSNTLTYIVNNNKLELLSNLSNFIMNNNVVFNNRPIIKNEFDFDVNFDISNFTICTNSIIQTMNVLVNKIGTSSTFTQSKFGSYLFLNGCVNDSDYLTWNDANDYSMNKPTSKFLNVEIAKKEIQTNENETLSFIQDYANYNLKNVEYKFYKNTNLVDTKYLTYSVTTTSFISATYAYSDDIFSVTGSNNIINNYNTIRLDIPTGTKQISNYTTYSFDKYSVQLKGNHKPTAIYSNDLDSTTGLIFSQTAYDSPAFISATTSLSSSIKYNSTNSLFVSIENLNTAEVFYIDIPVVLEANKKYKISYYYYSNFITGTYDDSSYIITSLQNFSDATQIAQITVPEVSSNDSPRRTWVKCEGVWSIGNDTTGNLQFAFYQSDSTSNNNLSDVYIDAIRIEYDTSDEYISELKTYNVIDIDSKQDLQRVIWSNKLGATEYFTMKKINEITNVKRDNFYKSIGENYTSKDRGVSNYFIQTQKEYVLTTDYINKEYDDLIQSLFTSPNIYFEVNGKLLPVILNNTSFKKRTKGIDKLISYDLTFSEATKNNSNI